MKKGIYAVLGLAFIGLLLMLLFLRNSLKDQSDYDNTENTLISSELLISNINIIDVANGQILKNRNVKIKDGRILKIEVNQETEQPYKPSRVIDATNTYLIPGLWDMHTHPDDPEVWRMHPTTKEKDLLLPLFVINGVTGIRDMAGDLNLIKRWRKLSKADFLIAPKIVAGGPLLDGPNPMWDGSVGINSPEQVKHIVDSLINEGVDFLKVYSLLPRDTYLALSEYANSIEFPFVGHVPFSVPPSEAAITGMKSQEHLLEILKECADKPSDSLITAIKSLGNGIDRSVAINNFRLKAFNQQKADSLYDLFKEHNIWHCPTLSMWYKNAWYEDEVEKDQDLLEYLPKYLQDYWTPLHNDHLKYRAHSEFIETKKRLYKKYLEIVKDMHDKDIPLLAGTDMGANPLCFPGIGLHNELKTFVEAGLTPLEAIKTATLNPAKFLEIDDDYGTISEGKIADLVILSKNPLSNINNIESITYVIKDGKILDKETIQNIKSKTLRAVDGLSKKK